MRTTILAAVVAASCLQAQTVSLQSVVVNGAQVTVTYSKDFATCAHLKLLNGALVHFQNVFCTSGTNVVVNVPFSGFNASFALGAQVMMCHGNIGSICSSPVTVTVAPALVGAPAAISLATAGVHQFTVDATSYAAGFTYLIAGSLSGTSPGFAAAGFFIALNPDDWFNITVLTPNVPPLSNTLGVLDSTGQGTGALTVPPGIPVVFAGLVLNHVVGVVTPAGVPVGVSAPVSLTLTP